MATSSSSTSSSGSNIESLTPLPAGMRAITVNKFGGPEVLELQVLNVPMPAAGQVLVKIMAAGVNPIETYMRAGNRPGMVTLPWTPGNDGAGEIVKLGEGVGHVKVGDRVFTTGTVSGSYAQYCLCDALSVHPLPDHITYEQGAAINVPYRTAYKALFESARATFGKTVLVHGASGGAGVATVQLAVAAGLQVFGTAGTEAGMEAVRKEGAMQVFNHRDPEHYKQILDATQGNGIDIIIEMAAHENLGNDLPILAKNGTVVVVGNRGPVNIDARNLMVKGAYVTGIVLDARSRGGPDITAIISGLRTGKLRPIVGDLYTLEKVQDAHVDVIEHKNGSAGKIILQPWAI